MAAPRRIRPEDPLHIATLNAAFPFQGHIDSTEHRGIKYDQLVQVSDYANDHCLAWRDLSPLSPTKGQSLIKESLNIYHINDWVIRPATRADDCAFVELLTSEPQHADWFICHWWGEKHRRFLEAIAEHCKVRAERHISDTVFWVCAYANRQHSHQVAETCYEEGFFKAMKLAHGLLLILGCPSDVSDGAASATAFTRTWCMFETCLAIFTLKKPVDVSVASSQIDTLIDGLTEQEQHSESRCGGRGFRNKIRRENGFPVHVLAAVLQCWIENTTCYENADLAWILQCVESGNIFGAAHACEQNCIDRMNKRFHAHFAVGMWFQAVESEGFNTERLADALIQDEWRTRLALNFAFCSKFDDSQLRILSSGIPKQLTSLELSFEMCQQVGNFGVAFLAKALPATLDTLVLNFQSCVNISNTGVDTLGDCFSSHLKVLRLNFSSDRIILSVHGLTDGIACLPNLLVLDLNLAGLDQLDSKEVIGLAKVLPRRLKNLTLSFAQCSRIDNAGVVVIAERLPCSLTTLKLDFKGCNQLSHFALDALAQHLPQGLLALSFNFEDCCLIREMCVAGLVRQLPESLYGAKVNLQGTPVSAEKQWICRRLDRMREWMPGSHDCQVGEHGLMSTPMLPAAAHWSDTLYLRSINYCVMASPESAHNSSARDGRSPKSRNKHGENSPSSLSGNTPSSRSKKTLLLELDRKCWPDNAKTRPKRSVSCPHLLPVRPSKPPTSMASVISSEAMFVQPRTVCRGRPVWLP